MSPVITVPQLRWKVMPMALPIRHPLRMQKKFSGKYVHKTIEGGIGHNLPQEAPKAFADAIIEADDYAG